MGAGHPSLIYYSYLFNRHIFYSKNIYSHKITMAICSVFCPYWSCDDFISEILNLCEKNAVKQLLCLRLILRYVGVSIHAEDVWMRVER